MRIRKELWFGFILMALIVAGAAYVLLAADTITRGHLGLLMLALVVVAIMLGFPTAFTLMGMGMIFTWIAYDRDPQRTLDLMVQTTFKVMMNDVLISIPLFVFMGYLVERANLIEKLFKSLHLAMARVPGSLAVATLVTCAIFATATGIVGAVVTLMGLLAFPQMLRAGYNVQLGAGAVTAGGCLGILIPPSVLLIVYGATAGVSVVQLYAGAFFPGLMLAGLYVLFVIIVAWWKPKLAPPLSAEARRVALPPFAEKLSAAFSARALPSLLLAVGSGAAAARAGVTPAEARRQLSIALLPAVVVALLMGWIYLSLTRLPEAPPAPMAVEEVAALSVSGLQEPPAEGLQEPPGAEGVKEPPGALAEPPPVDVKADAVKVESAHTAPPTEEPRERQPAPAGYWLALAIVAVFMAAFYAILSFSRLEIFKMLLVSFFPLVVLILAVLGSIVFGLATPTEAAAVGAFGGYVLAAIYVLFAKFPERKRAVLLSWAPFWAVFAASVLWYTLNHAHVIDAEVPDWLGVATAIGIGLWSLMAYRQVNIAPEVKESAFLTGKTTAMVCWLFVGSSIFSAAFALLGGQELVENWVVSLNLTKTQFLILSQLIIFILGWPLEWTEIIVIFMPIFIPLLDNFGVDPLFFGLLVALNLQTAFLSPPVAMAAFYLKGVSPPHVTLNQIFGGMLPFMGIQVLAILLLYVFPEIGLWLPKVLYGN
jgi:TRAP-type mannitol/chloroaromatic compound transport system permease large subunit